MNVGTSLAILALAALLAACSEKPQTAGTRKADATPWAGPPDAFVAQGWKVGDKASWEEQMRNRSRGQNEYVRIATP